MVEGKEEGRRGRQGKAGWCVRRRREEESQDTQQPLCFLAASPARPRLFVWTLDSLTAEPLAAAVQLCRSLFPLECSRAQKSEEVHSPCPRTMTQ